jgi:hypothetical protein
VRRILYTRHDAGVTLCTPAQECLEWLASGGYWDGRGIDIDEQIERAVSAGHREHAARRFVRAMDKGGCTTAEAYDIIRDRDCGHLGTAFELVTPEELPDRWFRDAWRRGHNGGPIDIDMETARKIQFRRIRTAIRRENKRREDDLTRFNRPLKIAIGAIRDKLHKADSAEDIRRIWPEELGSNV